MCKPFSAHGVNKVTGSRESVSILLDMPHCLPQILVPPSCVVLTGIVQLLTHATLPPGQLSFPDD